MLKNYFGFLDTFGSDKPKHTANPIWVNGFKERGFKELSFVLHVELEKCLKRVQNRKFEK
jgi:hypothetical protein